MTEFAFTKKQELFAFIVLTIVLAPVLSIIIVGGYGFIVWFLQIIFGSTST